MSAEPNPRGLTPERGLRLGGRYELRKRIAVGGMGEVWACRDLALGRTVATKLLRPELAGDARFLARLRAEARTSAPLAHPNIATLYDYGEDDGAGYLVMELVTGEPLADVLRREHVLAPDALLPILAQAARALHAAHVNGIVHRDVKPSNILLTPDGRVKITDFGISVATDSPGLTPRGTVLGTAQYLAPEQALGRPPTPSSDIYSLGVVAFEALAGRRPFTGGSLQEIAAAHVNRPAPELPAHVHEAVRAVVRSMLEKDPERRPRSAASLARTFERIAEDLDLRRGLEPPPTAERGRHADTNTRPLRGRHRGAPPLTPLPTPLPTPETLSPIRIRAERGGVIEVDLNSPVTEGWHTDDGAPQGVPAGPSDPASDGAEDPAPPEPVEDPQDPQDPQDRTRVPGPAAEIDNVIPLWSPLDREAGRDAGEPRAHARRRPRWWNWLSAVVVVAGVTGATSGVGSLGRPAEGDRVGATAPAPALLTTVQGAAPGQEQIEDGSW